MHLLNLEQRSYMIGNITMNLQKNGLVQIKSQYLLLEEEKEDIDIILSNKI